MTDNVAKLVGEAILAATPEEERVRQSITDNPGSYSWFESTPLGGFRAAQAVADMARHRGYEYLLKLRGQGTSWAAVADLLELPYSDEYARPERAFTLLAGDTDSSSAFSRPSVYWRCGGPGGCGALVLDYGPYDLYPSDCESGHSADCARAKADDEAARAAHDEQERADEVRHATFDTLTDSFDRSTVERCWWTLRHGGEIRRQWSTGEKLAVAVVLGDQTYLAAEGYSRKEAIRRVYDAEPAKVRARLDLLRRAATGNG